MKRLLCILLLLCLLTNLCGCALLQQLEPEIAYRYQEPYVGFAQTVGKEFSLEDYTRTSESQIEAYEPQWSQYASDVYYSQLDEAGQKLYRILRYAMEHAQPYLLIDERLLEGTAFSVQDILYAVALDSPVVEQNLEWQRADFTSTVTHPRLFSPDVEETLKGLSLYISDFAPERLEKKNKALEKARQILAAFPEGLTPLQMADTIYTYLGENVQYFNTEINRESVDYLYDALCMGRSNCDGFANAFSLLCSLSGIRCCEKMSLPEAEDVPGHTWNALELDGIWYNVDATAADEVAQEESLRLHFGFADHRQDPEHWRNLSCPPCDRELYAYDCTLSGEKGAGKTLKAALKKVDRDYLIVYVETGKLSDAALQEIANTTRHDIVTYHAETLDGAVVCYIYFD